MTSEEVRTRHPLAGTHNALAPGTLPGSEADARATVRAILLMHHHWQRSHREIENRWQYLEALWREASEPE
jgi:hypothetical protein